MYICIWYAEMHVMRIQAQNNWVESKISHDRTEEFQNVRPLSIMHGLDIAC